MNMQDIKTSLDKRHGQLEGCSGQHNDESDRWIRETTRLKKSLQRWKWWNRPYWWRDFEQKMGETKMKG